MKNYSGTVLKELSMACSTLRLSALARLLKNNKDLLIMRSVFPFILLFFTTIAYGQKKTIDQKVDSVLKLMTLDEKVGQMNQYNGPWEHTGPITEQGDLLRQIKEGKVGSMLNVNGAVHTKDLQ